MEAAKTMERYEKPAMKFVSLRSEEAVANTCWGYHGTGTLLYCDIPGEGYCSFQIGGGSCTLNLVNVIYYDSEQKASPATSEQLAILDSILRNSGGESGNPYKGEGSTVIPDHPGEWS